MTKSVCKEKRAFFQAVSKHLKGQSGPALMTSRFFNRRGQLPRITDVTFFGSKPVKFESKLVSDLSCALEAESDMLGNLQMFPPVGRHTGTGPRRPKHVPTVDRPNQLKTTN